MGKGKSVKIGYRYYFGIHMGIGRGPVDELVQIKVADETAWTGSITGNGPFTINSPNLFGGDKGEGGIQGSAYMLMGDADQPVYGPLATMLGGLVPAFRGRATLFYDGLVTSINPYPKAWAMRVRRALKGWQNNAVWYPSRAIINLAGGAIKAMNPAHILVEGATNVAWGRGLNIGRLDLPAYQAAADTLYAEGFGLCFRWSRSSDISEFLQLVLDHIGAVQAIDRRTGLLTLKLIRQDYDIDDLPLFDFSNGLLAVEDLETAAFDSSTNQVLVKYKDPITNEERTSAPITNLAAVQASGVTLTTTTEYFAIPTYDLAGRVAERDLQISMGAMRRMTLHFDRRAAWLKPGAVFKVSAPDYGIGQLVVRAGKVSDGTLREGSITVVAIQDLFGMPATTYVDPEPSGYVPPDRIPRPVTARAFWELSYRDLYRSMDQANFQLIESDMAYVGTVGVKPAGVPYNYRLWTSTSSSTTAYREAAAGDWTPSGLLAEAMPLGTVQRAVQLYSYSGLDQVIAGDPARIDNEEFIVVGVNASTGIVTLARGSLDTIPSTHAQSARIWFYNDRQAEDALEYASGQTLYARMLTHTSAGDLAISAAPADTLQSIARQGRPYPPGNLRISGQSLDSIDPVARPIVVSWSHRSKEVQGDQLFDHNYGNIGPSAGITYTLRILNMAGTVLRTVTGLTGTSWTYTSEFIAADGLDALNGLFRIQLWSEQDGLPSWQRYDIPLILIKPGLGYSLGYYLGGEE